MWGWGEGMALRRQSRGFNLGLCLSPRRLPSIPLPSSPLWKLARAWKDRSAFISSGEFWEEKEGGKAAPAPVEVEEKGAATVSV